MTCPLYNDFTRECLDYFDGLLYNTYEYCESSDYNKCPFYKAIKKEGPVCDNIFNCPFCKLLSNADFNKYKNILDDYCLTEKYKECERWKKKNVGKKVPDNLFPDGTVLDVAEYH